MSKLLEYHRVAPCKNRPQGHCHTKSTVPAVRENQGKPFTFFFLKVREFQGTQATEAIVYPGMGISGDQKQYP